VDGDNGSDPGRPASFRRLRPAVYASCLLTLSACGDAGEPAQVRVHRSVVNVISPEAARELDAFLETGYIPSGAAHAFYGEFLDDYDFLFLLTDDYADGRTPPLPHVAGRHLAINRPRIPGTGIGESIDQAFFGDAFPDTPRLRSILGIRAGMAFGSPVMGPLAHELAHHWANHLDPKLGLTGTPTHFTCLVVGQLGCDASMQWHCFEPAGASPPDCTPDANGRYRLYTSRASRFEDTRYAPLELYLMGLIPASEVPRSFPGPRNPRMVANPDPGKYADVIEADGFDEIPFAAVIQRHGERTPVPAAERHLKAAFAVVTREPAPEALLDAVADGVEVFGNLRPPLLPIFRSFEWLTSGRATLDVALQARRNRRRQGS
jgi:hypothetical protein